MDRRYRDLKKLARRYDYDVVYTGRSGHGQLVCRRGERPPIPVSGSPTNVDSWLQEIDRMLRRVEKGVYKYGRAS